MEINKKIFAKTIENKALAQINDLTSSDAYIGCKIRIMPDVHAGNGCTIGTTIKIKDKICPNTVGVDICCGMLVIELGNIDIDLAYLDNIINKYVPCGFHIHEEPICLDYELFHLKCKDVVDFSIANKSIGTLGGGNHFIEVDIDNDNNKYLIIHSGSRNLGGKSM